MDKTEKNKLNHTLLALLPLAYIFRMALPSFKFVFIPLFAYFLVITGLDFYRNWKKQKWKNFLKPISLYLALLILYLIALFNKPTFLFPYKEFISGVVMLLIILMIYLKVNTKEKFDKFKIVLLNEVIIITGIVALLGIIKYFLSVFSIHVPLVPTIAQSSLNTSLNSDYNFYVLAIFWGFIGILYLMITKNKLSRKKLNLFNLILVFYSLNILLSQSRRGFILFVLVFGLILISRIIVLFLKNNLKLLHLRRTDGFVFSMLGISLVFYLLFAFTSDNLKKQFLVDTRIYKSDFRYVTTSVAHRYLSFFNNAELGDFYYDLWMQDKEESTLRKNIKDYLDSKFLRKNFSYDLHNGDFKNGLKTWRQWGNSDINLIKTDHSNVVLVNSKARNEGISNNIYIDVGDTATITAFVKVIQWSENLRMATKSEDGKSYSIAKPKKEWEGDDKWHNLKLQVPFDIFGSVPLWVGGGSPDKSSVSLWSDFQVCINEIPKVQLNNHQLPKITQAQLEKILDTENQSNLVVKKDLDYKKYNRIKDYSLLSYLEQVFKTNAQTASKKSQELNIYGTNKEELKIGRLERWSFAFQLFKEYPFFQKVFGDGFSYLEKYGEKYYDSSNVYDYPHNPLISVILYSGIFGLMAYILFLTAGFIIYVKNCGSLDYFLILFIFTGLFVSISGNSHFSIPSFNFLSLLPFYYFSLKGKSVK